jgi:catalase
MATRKTPPTDRPAPAQPARSSRAAAADDKKSSARPSKAAARGATSAKGTLSGPSTKDEVQPRRGLLERAATALGSGSSSASQSTRDAAVTQRLQAKLDAT